MERVNVDCNIRLPQQPKLLICKTCNALITVGYLGPALDSVFPSSKLELTV